MNLTFLSSPRGQNEDALDALFKSSIYPQTLHDGFSYRPVYGILHTVSSYMQCLSSDRLCPDHQKDDSGWSFTPKIATVTNQSQPTAIFAGDPEVPSDSMDGL